MAKTRYWYEHRSKKKAKNHFEKDYISEQIYKKIYKKSSFLKKKSSLYIMIKSLSLAEEHTIKDIRNLFRLKKEQITLSVE